jgi:hypothetical protein
MRLPVRTFSHSAAPLSCGPLAESANETRLRDEPALDASAFFEEIQVMVQFKMALGRHGEDSAGARTRRWIFRHDKTRDFFLMHAFLADQEDRVLRHLDDPASVESTSCLRQHCRSKRQKH